MKKREIVRWSAIILNLLNAVLVAVSIAYYFTGSGAGNMQVGGSRCFVFFTNDSNILSAVTSLILLPFLLKKRVPRWTAVLKFVGTVSVTVTLLTVVCFLGPTQGYARMFDGVCLYLHLLCPLLSVASVYLPEYEEPLPKASWMFGTLPVVVYGLVYYVMVVVTGRWADFYGFNRGGRWYLSLIAMFALGALLSFLMALLQRKAAFRRVQKNGF